MGEIPDREPRCEFISKARTKRRLMSGVLKGGTAHFAVRIAMKENKARIGPVIVDMAVFVKVWAQWFLGVSCVFHKDGALRRA
jgi:hypothetical protein